MNTCNPVFITVGLRLGVEKYYYYFESFGLLNKTGVDLPGEAGTIMHKMEDMKAVELATVSFGQSFQITPKQLDATDTWKGPGWEEKQPPARPCQGEAEDILLPFWALPRQMIPRFLPLSLSIIPRAFITGDRWRLPWSDSFLKIFFLIWKKWIIIERCRR